jgi:transcriptional regulator with XRE-family HTH domain
MHERSISQNEMARRMRLSSGTFSKYMAGERIPSCGFVLRAFRALTEVKAVQLLDEDPPAKFMAQPEGSPPPRAASVASVAQSRKRRQRGGGIHGE